MSGKRLDAAATNGFMLRVFAAALPALLPPVVGFVAAALVRDSIAKEPYYEITAQILPLLTLVLVLERNFVFRSPEMPPAPEDPRLESPANRRDWFLGAATLAMIASLRVGRTAYWVIAILYQLVLLVLLAAGEFTALKALATGESSVHDLHLTVWALVSGFCAILMLALIGAVRVRHEALAQRQNAA